MKAKNIFSNNYLRAGLLIIAGIFIGWLFFNNSGSTVKSAEPEVHEHSEAKHIIWTCAMHPQIRMDEPGDCPICGMDLIPLKSSNAEVDDQAIEMSESAIKLAEVQTTIVSKGSASKDLQLYGKIQVDERLKQSQTAHVPGRIEKLMINVTGEQVRKGQRIASIYSPELITAQKELIEALSLKDKYPALVEAAREKLRNWKLSEEQISNMEKSGNVTTTFDIFANTSGVVVAKNVNVGDYISKGAVLFDVTDLSKVWGVFDAYESDLPWISLNQLVDFTTKSVPGKTFSGKIAFIDPVIDPTKRIAGIRIELNNSERQLKPEMFINGTIHSTLKGGGEQLTVPQSAVLWTGTRSVVYVKIPDAELPTFKMREITLGPAMKNTYIVVDGLSEGEEIVTNGTFSVDAAAQLAGKTSMMNPSADGARVSSGSMAGMDMSGGDKTIHADESKNMKANKEPMKPDPKFKAQLTKVYDAYLEMKNAFVATNAEKVSSKAKDVNAALKRVEMGLLEDDAHMKLWMEQLKILNSSIESIAGSGDIEIQRKAFARFSPALYTSLKTFGLDGQTAYYQYCPMAFDNQGAYWLSEDEQIRNPYFGDMMLKCGETRDTLK